MLIGDVIPLWKIDEAWGRELNVRLNVWCRRRSRRWRWKRMLGAQKSRISTPHPPTPRRARRDLKFMTYFTTGAVLELQTLAVNWPARTSKFHLAGGAFILGHESGWCSVHVNVQLLGKGGDSLCPPIIVCSHLRGSKGPLCLFGLLSHHFS